MATHLIIDSHNIICRCYHGIPLYYSTTNLPVNAIEGWINSISAFQNRFPGSRLWCAFDGARSERKHRLLDSYKSSREEKDVNLAIQIPLIRRITPFMGLTTFYDENEEADDLIASLIHKLKLQYPGDLIFVATNDKDICQCVDHQVYLLKPPVNSRVSKSWTVEGADYVQTKFGIEPKHVVDYLCMVGDKSDTIPGISGVGPKTAAKLLNTYHTLEGIYANMDAIRSAYPQLYLEFLAQKDAMFTRNRPLIQLDATLPIELTPSPSKDIYNLSLYLKSFGMEHMAFSVEQSF